MYSLVIEFPSTLVVDREIYEVMTELIEKIVVKCFRPLPRLIGSIPVTVPTKHDTLYQFPAPLEVDRCLYEDLG